MWMAITVDYVGQNEEIDFASETEVKQKEWKCLLENLWCLFCETECISQQVCKLCRLQSETF